MSWIVDNSLSFFQKFCVNILKCGPIPRHVGFIMDGNRRYAKKIKVEKAEGHSKGFDKLAETLQWCLELGIKEVTVYAFSIENFKRPESEVQSLMNLATEKFEKLLEEQEKLMEEGVCVRVIGNLGLLRKDLQKLIGQVMLLTQHNTKVYLNIAFAYTSREEITTAFKTVVNGVKRNSIEIDDISDKLLSECLYTTSNPELLVRTSGEVRLSDFLLWQISNTVVYFTKVLWPEFSFWDFVICIFKYQMSCYYLRKNNYKCINSGSNLVKNKQIENFLYEVKENRLAVLQSFVDN